MSEEDLEGDLPFEMKISFTNFRHNH